MLQRKLAARGCSIIASIIGMTTSASAGINSFTPLGPDGGEIYKVAFHPTNASIAYASTQSGFYRSTDAGLSWTLSPCTRGQFISDFAVDPTNGDRVFIAAPMHVVAVSTDAGATCSGLNAFPGEPNAASDIEASSDGTLYAIVVDRLFRSGDAGSTWDEIPLPDDVSFPRTLRVDPADSNAVFLVNDDVGFRSTNGGSTWASFDLPPIIFFDWVIAPHAPRVIFAATDAGIHISSNDGNDWSPIGPAGAAFTVAVHPTDPDSQTLYAGIYVDGLQRSTNQGGTWENVQGTARSGSIKSIAISPVTPDLVLMGGTEGLARSSDAGGTWSSVNTGITATLIEEAVAAPASQRIYFHTSSTGIFALDPGAARAHAVNPDGLAAVTPLNDLLSFDLVVRGEAADQLLVSTNNGFMQSNDGGQHWAWVVVPYGAIEKLSVAPEPSNNMLMSAFSGMYRSTDGGSSWNPIAGLGPAVIAAFFARSANAPSTIFAGLLDESTLPSGTTEPLGIYRSIDDGENWTAINGNMPARYITRIEVDPRTDETLYILTSDGVFKTVNGGESWTQLNVGTASVSSISLDTTRPDTLYAVHTGRVARSIDAGATWQDLYVPTGMFDRWGGVFADPFRPHTILATDTSGVADMTVATDLELEASVPPALPHGLPTSFSYTVRNLGPFHASDVRTVIQLPPGTEGISASATAGSCTVAAVTVTCSQPVLRAAGVTEITITSTHSAEGEAEITATAQSSEPDLDSSNNAAASTILVDQVSDLSITAVAPGTTSEGSSINYSFVIANAGPQDATDVTATIQLAAGLSLGTATSSQGTCTAGEGGRVICEIGELAIDSDATISISTAAASRGTYEMSATVDASGSDPVSANNSAAASTTVNARSSGGSGGGGGGGSSSLWLIAALLCFGAHRRMREQIRAQ